VTRKTNVLCFRPQGQGCCGKKAGGGQEKKVEKVRGEESNDALSPTEGGKDELIDRRQLRDEEKKAKWKVKIKRKTCSTVCQCRRRPGPPRILGGKQKKKKEGRSEVEKQVKTRNVLMVS